MIFKSQIRDLFACKYILDLTSKCVGADWTEQNKFFQTFLNLSNLAFFYCSKIVQNGIKMAIFFPQKLQKLPS